MKVLKWYSLIIVALSMIALVAEMMSYGFNDSSFLGIVMYLPILYYLWKKCIGGLDIKVSQK